MEDDIRCILSWVDETPKLIIEFSGHIHPDNVREMANVIEKTISKWINCKSCEMDYCDKGYH
jgi:hypothetical protein